ncbi:MAG: A/G-specific adenine glycosylase [Agathobacter sp.]|nr:A/G-specific adenine glycosylase [Agathobacter sp.]
MIDDFNLRELILPLQEWFLKNARVLPWREEATPYHVWVSEIMLQQTRVEAVKPYFARFTKELPDVAALAVCPEDKLLKLWEGLGYYNRVRNMQEAARQIMEDFAGEIPSDYEALLTLKGIGNYTAGAISSIAYGKKAPAVDGNVLRVISRVTGDDSDIMKQSVRKNMEQRLFSLMENAEELIPGVFNQGLMELGAMVCVPNGKPHCENCPWEAMCVARRQDLIDVLPVKNTQKKRRIEEMTVLLIRDGEKIVLHKRPKKGLLAGLYELPNLSGYQEKEAILSYVESLGFLPLRIKPVGEAKHIFSHVEWHMKGYMVFVGEMEPKPGEWLLVDVEEARNSYAIPAAFSKYAEYINIPIGKEAFTGSGKEL